MSIDGRVVGVEQDVGRYKESWLHLEGVDGNTPGQRELLILNGAEAAPSLVGKRIWGGDMDLILGDVVIGMRPGPARCVLYPDVIRVILKKERKMKFRIVDKAEPHEPVMDVRLEMDGSDGIKLVARCGEIEKVIVRLTEKGFQRAICVNPLPFPLDSEGRVQFYY